MTDKSLMQIKYPAKIIKSTLEKEKASAFFVHWVWFEYRKLFKCGENWFESMLESKRKTDGERLLFSIKSLLDLRIIELSLESLNSDVNKPPAPPSTRFIHRGKVSIFSPLGLICERKEAYEMYHTPEPKKDFFMFIDRGEKYRAKRDMLEGVL